MTGHVLTTKRAVVAKFTTPQSLTPNGRKGRASILVAAMMSRAASSDLSRLPLSPVFRAQGSASIRLKTVGPA